MRRSELFADEAAAGHGPRDVQAVAPQDLASEARLADGVQAGDRLAVFVECLKLLVDRGSAFRRREVSLCRAEQRPLSIVERLAFVGCSLVVGLSDCASKSVRRDSVPVSDCFEVGRLNSNVGTQPQIVGDVGVGDLRRGRDKVGPLAVAFSE